jgi:hypothetical protein
MKEFCEMWHTTSEQHKEEAAAGTPFSDETTLRKPITGINADDDVNVHDLFTVGREVDIFLFTQTQH